jgi:Txe/YoeB family toxin of toxin-antitoxin system
MYKVIMTRQAEKDSKLIERAGLKPKAVELIRTVKSNPFQNPPEYEKLMGVKDTYSRRINKKHRFVYQVHPNIGEYTDENNDFYKGIVKIIRMWTHYE